MLYPAPAESSTPAGNGAHVLHLTPADRSTPGGCDTLTGMADLERSPGRRPSRAQRERRAYQLTLATGGLAVVAVVGFVLAIAGVIGFGIPVLAAILAVVAGLILRRSLGV